VSLLERRNRAIPRGLANVHPLFVARARGARLWDVDGREYLDFMGGIGVLAVGHNHPRVVRAVQEQLERVSHTCFQAAMYEPYVRVAERLGSLMPGAFPKKALLLSTGAEAVENAIKIARAATGRPAIVAFTHSFHGRTLLGLSLTGKSQPYRQTFGPFAPEVYHAPYPYPYRGWSEERALEALQELFVTQVAPGRIAAVIIEPVLGEGGFIPAGAEFLRRLREITRQHGILLIADEIQTGFGRTGRMLAVEASDVVPDLVTVAKSLAGGLPLSAVIGRADVMDAPLAVLDVFAEEGLLGRAGAMAEQLRRGLEAIAASFPAVVGEVRGLGPMLALELVSDARTRTPAPELARAVVAAARERGLLLLTAGLHGNVVRLLVPLVASAEEVAEGLERLLDALSASSSTRGDEARVSQPRDGHLDQPPGEGAVPG